MLKKPASFVLGSSKSSTYPRGYASGFDSPAALLNGLFEHPPKRLPVGHNKFSHNLLSAVRRQAMVNFTRSRLTPHT